MNDDHDNAITDAEMLARFATPGKPCPLGHPAESQVAEIRDFDPTGLFRCEVDGLTYRPEWTESGTLRYDDNDNPIVVVAECGACERKWNDALITGTTPAPAARCPFEYEHDEPDDKPYDAREEDIEDRTVDFDWDHRSAMFQVTNGTPDTEWTDNAIGYVLDELDQLDRLREAARTS